MSEGDSPVTVVVHAELDPEEFAIHHTDPNLDRWQALAEQALRTEGVTAGELDLSFITSDAMTELNETHMGKVGPTDVLAFPIDGEDDPGEPAIDGLPVLLGDVVICPEVAHANATGDGKATDDEIALLVVHGVLHVLGHDHQHDDERAAMRARERALLEAHHR
ncbi:MAG: rRNA maturation RNase YbeY [Actinomycetota bacterium]